MDLVTLHPSGMMYSTPVGRISNFQPSSSAIVYTENVNVLLHRAVNSSPRGRNLPLLAFFFLMDILVLYVLTS